MFMNAVVSIFAALLLSASTMVDARVVPRDVITPPVLYPTNGTQWFIGQRHNVTWDTSVAPVGFTGTGMIVLGHLEGTDIDEHLDLDHPLAEGFLLITGRTEITVPSVPAGDSYIVILFGDSGNKSGKFTIANMTISSGPGPATTTPPVAPGSTGSGTPSSGATPTVGGSIASTPSAAAGSPSEPSGSGSESSSSPNSSVISTPVIGTTLIFPSSSASSSSSSASVSTASSTSPAQPSSGTPTQNNSGSHYRFNSIGASLAMVVLGAFAL